MAIRELINRLSIYSEKADIHVVVGYPDGRIVDITNLYDIVGDLHRTIVIQSD